MFNPLKNPPDNPTGAGHQWQGRGHPDALHAVGVEVPKLRLRGACCSEL